MTLEGRHIWLATRGGERAPLYQSVLVAAIEAAGAETVEVVGVEGLVRSAATDLGERAGDWIESTAGRLARGLRIDRLLGARPDGEGDDAEQASTAPDLVLVDDARLLQALRLTPRYRRATPLTVALVDDFSVDTRWRGAGVDAVVVPHEVLARVYRGGDGAPEVVVAGPPVDPVLASDQQLAAAKTALGLPVDQPVVIVVAEHFRLDLLDRAVFQLTLLDVAPTVLFYHGGSSERAQVLREAAVDYGLRAQMFGTVDRLAAIFAAADLVLAPADDPAAVDLLLANRPVVLVGPDRGTARATFLADQGAVLHVEEVVELGTHLETLLSADMGRGLVEVAGTMVRPDGCQRVAAALGDLWSAFERRRAQPPEPEPEAPEPEEAPSPEPPLVKAPAGARFESIGAATAAARGGAEPPLTAAEAKDQMATLIIKEREAERTLNEAVKNRDRWLGRLELAKDFTDQELTEVASEKLRLVSAQVARLNGQIETLRRSKAKLKARVERSQPTGSRPAASAEPPADSVRSGGSAIESRFRKMEIDRDLSRLRRRLDDDR